MMQFQLQMSQRGHKQPKGKKKKKSIIRLKRDSNTTIFILQVGKEKKNHKNHITMKGETHTT